VLAARCRQAIFYLRVFLALKQNPCPPQRQQRKPLGHKEGTILYSHTETLIEYHPDDLDAWKRGEKKKWLGGRVVPPEVYNQPRYHFGEYFVLNYFEKAWWHGFCDHNLGYGH
jgi:hypothetical protein